MPVDLFEGGPTEDDRRCAACGTTLARGLSTCHACGFQNRQAPRAVGSLQPGSIVKTCTFCRTVAPADLLECPQCHAHLGARVSVYHGPVSVICFWCAADVPSASDACPSCGQRRPVSGQADRAVAQRRSPRRTRCASCGEINPGLLSCPSCGAIADDAVAARTMQMHHARDGDAGAEPIGGWARVGNFLVRLDAILMAWLGRRRSQRDSIYRTWWR